MPTRPYKFFINPFLVVTKTSYKLALSIGEDHLARLTGLQADPDVAALLATTTPIVQAYKTTDQNLQAAEGTYEGSTATVEELFAALNNTHLAIWEGQVHFVYPQGTPAEINLFPDRRKVFQAGTYEQRISAIKVLGDKCALDANPVIAGVGAVILAFHVTIEGARLLQQGSGEAVTAALRVLRENARVLMCKEIYGNMGRLMQKHRANPLDVAQYFQISYLRQADSNTEEFDIEPQEVENILDNFVAGETTGIKVKNTSDENVTLMVYLGDSISEEPSGTPYLIHQGEEITINEADFGGFKPFLNAFNQSGHLGTFEVKFN